MFDLEDQVREYVGFLDRQTRRVSTETAIQRSTAVRRPMASRRMAIVAISVLAILVFVGSVAFLDLFGGEQVPITEPDSITTMPTSTTTPPVTTTTPTTTTTGATTPTEVTLSWTPIHSEAFGGEDGYRFLEAVTVGGPGLVAVGGACDRTGFCEDESGWTAAVYTSTDGSTWQRVPHDEGVFGGPGDQIMLDVTTGGPGLVAVGVVDPSFFAGMRWQGLTNVGPLGDLDGAIWTSIDGIAWERVEDPDGVFTGEGDQIITAVIRGGPGLIAVGASSDDAAVWISTDGMTWTMVPQDEGIFGGDSNQWMFDVTTGGPGYVAVGGDWNSSGRSLLGEPFALIWTSDDGLEWSRVSGVEEADSAAWTVLWAVAGVPGEGLVASGWTYNWDTEVRWTTPDGLEWQPGDDQSSLASGTKWGPVTDLIAYQGQAIGVGWDPESVTRDIEYRQYFPTFTYDYYNPRISKNGVVIFNDTLIAVGYDGVDAAAWIGELSP